MAINETFKRIQVRVQAMLQNTSTSTSNANDLLPKVKDWTNQRYNRILRAYPWNELLRTADISVAAGAVTQSLGRDIEKIIKIWDKTNGREIKPRSIQQQIEHFSPVYEVSGNVSTGNVSYYIEIGTKSVSTALSTADKIQVLSSSTADDSPIVVRVVGEVSSVPLAESITLNGTTAVDSTNTYDSGAELTVSVGTSDGTIDDTAGTITVREKTSGSTVAQVAAEEHVPTYLWVKWHPKNVSAATFEVWYKRKWRRLVNDNDIPIIECADEIIEGVTADALWEDGQENAAAAQEQKFSTAVQELWLSKKPRDLVKQFIPDNIDTELETDRIFFV